MKFFRFIILIIGVAFATPIFAQTLSEEASKELATKITIKTLQIYSQKGTDKSISIHYQANKDAIDNAKSLDVFHGTLKVGGNAYIELLTGRLSEATSGSDALNVFSNKSGLNTTMTNIFNSGTDIKKQINDEVGIIISETWSQLSGRRERGSENGAYTQRDSRTQESANRANQESNNQSSASTTSTLPLWIAIAVIFLLVSSTVAVLFMMLIRLKKQMVIIDQDITENNKQFSKMSLRVKNVEDATRAKKGLSQQDVVRIVQNQIEIAIQKKRSEQNNMPLNQSTNAPQPTKTQSQPIAPVNIPITPITNKTIYVSTSIDGKFTKSTEALNVNASNFMIEIDRENPTKGDLYTIPSNLDPERKVYNRYKNQKDTILIPVCIELNANGNNEIITSQPGEVSLENSCWVIKEKIQISHR